MHAFVTYFRPVSLPINGSPPHDRVPIFRVGNLKRERKRYPLVVSRFSPSPFFITLNSKNIFSLKFARVCLYTRAARRVRIRGKLGGNPSLYSWSERVAWKGDLQSPRSNESQSISRRVLVACSTSYNATVSDSYRFRHFRGMRTLSSRAFNNSIRRSFLSLSECFNSKRRDLEPLIRLLIGTNRSRVSFHYTRTIIPYHSKMEFRDGGKIKKKIKRGRKNWKNYGLTTVKVTLALRRNVNRDRVVGRRRF